MTEQSEKLGSLTTSLIDTRNGYFEALDDAGPRGLTTLFQEMIALHTEAIVELEPLTVAAGGDFDQDGSFMSTVHRTVISIRSIFGGLDEGVLPALINGEERILSHYDDALSVCANGNPAFDALTRHRDKLAAKIDRMRVLRDTAA